MNTVGRLIIIIFLTMNGSGIFSQEINSLQSALSDAEKQFFIDNHDSNAMAMLNELSGQIRSLGNGTAAMILRAEEHLLRGFFAMSMDRRSPAIRALEEAEAITQRLLSQNLSDSLRSRALSIAVESIMYQANIKGIFYQMANGAAMESYPQEAMSLDPNNLRAVLMRAVFLTSAPPLVGGDAGLAVQLLSGALDDAEDVLRFRILAWLGSAHKRQGNDANANRSWNQALEIIPGNLWVKRLMDA